MSGYYVYQVTTAAIGGHRDVISNVTCRYHQIHDQTGLHTRPGG